MSERRSSPHVPPPAFRSPSRAACRSFFSSPPPLSALCYAPSPAAFAPSMPVHLPLPHPRFPDPVTRPSCHQPAVPLAPRQPAHQCLGPTHVWVGRGRGVTGAEQR